MAALPGPPPCRLLDVLLRDEGGTWAWKPPLNGSVRSVSMGLYNPCASTTLEARERGVGVVFVSSYSTRADVLAQMEIGLPRDLPLAKTIGAELVSADDWEIIVCSLGCCFCAELMV